ncbi:MAG: glycerophosphodiester phosphodiesterase [Candidatus Omnitrophica bacterium]|nr:glycerophosphodiester phosphodiesterase [Candidatus Omnitrophota bacterium]
MAERRGPLLVAHRGDPAHAPENTLASFRSAVAKGAKAVEMDLRRSADGVWVVFHDSTLRRMTGRSGRVARTGWPALRRLRSGGEPIPTALQALQWCRREGVRAFLDVKEAEGEASLFRVIRRSGGMDQVMVGAGKPASLKRWRRLLGERPLFWVTGFRVPVTRRLVDRAGRMKLAGLAAYRRWANRAAVARAHRAGLKLYLWTARTPIQIRRLSALGADGIMSEVWDGRRV